VVFLFESVFIDIIFTAEIAISDFDVRVRHCTLSYIWIIIIPTRNMVVMIFTFAMSVLSKIWRLLTRYSQFPLLVIYLPHYLILAFQQSEANNSSPSSSHKRAKKLFYESSESAQIDTLNVTRDIMERLEGPETFRQMVGVNLSFVESAQIGTWNDLRDIFGRPDHGHDVDETRRQINQALCRFFKPQFGSPEYPPSARVVLEAMKGSSQGFQVVKRSSGLIYNMRTPAGDPLRRYMALFRS